MEKKVFTSIVALAFLYIISPLLLPVAMGAVLAVLFYPWFLRARGRRIPAALVSSVITLGVTVLLILPSSLLIFFAAKTAFSEVQIWNSTSSQGVFDALLERSGVQEAIAWVTGVLPMDPAELTDSFQELAGRLGGRLTELIGGMLSHLPGIFLSLGIVVVSLYFFLVDGHAVVALFRANSFFDRKQTDEMLSALGEMCRSVILASVVSGGLQALIEFVACLVTGTPHLALIGLVVFMASFFPVVGSAPITFGIAIHQLILGRQSVGILLFFVAGFIVAVDNVVRPMILKGSTDLHPLVAFIAAFGGLQTLGVLGVFLGPIVAALFVVTLHIVMRKPSTT